MFKDLTRNRVTSFVQPHELPTPSVLPTSSVSSPLTSNILKRTKHHSGKSPRMLQDFLPYSCMVTSQMPKFRTQGHEACHSLILHSCLCKQANYTVNILLKHRPVQVQNSQHMAWLARCGHVHPNSISAQRPMVARSKWKTLRGYLLLPVNIFQQFYHYKSKITIIITLLTHQN